MLYAELPASGIAVAGSIWLAPTTVRYIVTVAIAVFAGFCHWLPAAERGMERDGSRGAPTVVLAQDGRAMLPVIVALDGLVADDLGRDPNAWRALILANTYQMAYFAGKVDVRAKGDENRRGQVLLMVDDLKRCLRRMVGAEFDVRVVAAFPEDSTPGLYIGARDQFAGGELPGDLGPEEFVQRTTGDGRILVAGGAWSGTCHGVYTLLDTLGCRWFFPGETWEVVPEAKDVSVAVDERRGPSFAIQRVFAVGHGEHSAAIGRDMMDWRRRNRMGAPFRVMVSECWPGFSRDDFEDHPEWFALVDGKRQPSKPCYSNPEVIRRGIASSLDYLAKHPGESMVSASPPDGVGFCECELCMAVAGVSAFRKEGYTLYGDRPDGTLVTLPSETIFNYANKVAGAVAERFPGKHVGTLAYSSHSHPPSFDLRPNVYVEITRGYRRTPLTMDEQLRAFAGRCGQLGIYEYYDVEQWHWDKPGCSRATKLDAIQASLRYFHANNMRSVKGEISNNWGPNGIGYYVIARLLWDVDNDARSIEETLYREAFGPAAEPLRRLYRRWEIGYPVDGKGLGLAQRDLKEAVELTSANPACRARVDRIRMYLHFLKHYIPPTASASALREMFKDDVAEENDAVTFEIIEDVDGPDVEDLMAATGHVQAQKRVGYFGNFVSRLMNTHMTHSFPFNSALAKGAEGLACDTKNWRKPGRIPTAREVDEFSAADLAGLDMTTLRDIPIRFYSHDLVALNMAVPGLFSSVAPPVECGRVRGGRLLVLAGRGESVKIALRGPVQRVGIGYQVSFISEDAFRKGWGEFVHSSVAAGRIEKDTPEPVITFKTPDAGYCRVTWQADANLDMAGVAGVSHPAIVTRGMFFRSATLYFFVPKGTRRFALGTAAKGGPSAVITDGTGATVLEAKRDPGNGALRRLFTVDVPAGSDGAVWSFSGPDDGRVYAPVRLLGIPDCLSFRPDQLLVPREVVE